VALTAWCSWYAHGARVTAHDMLAARASMSRLRAHHGVALDFLLIDDGFQERMGDWLVGSPDLGLPLTELLHALLSSNVSIGLWLAPFIASKGMLTYADVC
jgi:alpha-galactosidase